MERLERLSPLDVWFWDVEGATNHQNIGCIAVLEGPQPSACEVRDRLAEVLPTVPRARQRCVPSPLGLARPAWVDDDPDLDYHVRATAVPPPGGGAELATLVGRVMSQPIDRSRPLWEMWVVSGLAGGRWAIVSKVHHCVVDGVAGVDLMTALFDLTPEPQPVAPQLPATNGTPRGRTGWVADAVRALVEGPVDGVRRGMAAVRHPRGAARSAARLGRGAFDLLSSALPTRDHGLNDRIGSHRVYAVGRATIDQISEVRRHEDVTFNDVALAAVSHGFAELLRSREGAVGPGATIRTLVPVSVRTEEQRGRADNRISVLLADLPIGIADPLERLRWIHEETERHKRTGEADAGAALLGLLDVLPAPLVEVGTRLAGGALDRVVQRSVTTVTTNVPGPQQPLYVLGRRIAELFPYILIGEGLTVGVAMMSYDGKLTFGVTGDLDRSPDVAVLAAGIEDGMAELVAAVRASSRLPVPV